MKWGSINLEDSAWETDSRLRLPALLMSPDTFIGKHLETEYSRSADGS
jgi:hypothetical protein